MRNAQMRAFKITAFLLFTLFLLFIVFALAPIAARADQALVVGVNTYPNLASLSQLDGCVNDAGKMAACLQTLGFKVTPLNEGAANKAAILSAIAEIASHIQPSERFVFYFAGHGATDSVGKGIILAADANDVRETGYIGEQELYNAVAAVPARTRTVVLDSCCSGEMSDALAKALPGVKLTSRYYNFFHLAPKKSIQDYDPMQPSSSGNVGPTKICYFDAADGDQSASETPFDGVEDGVFTHSLVNRLQTLAMPWSYLQAEVSGDVLQITVTESPIVSPGYQSADVFEAPESSSLGQPGTPAAPRAIQISHGLPGGSLSLWNTFGEECPDPNQLSLTLQPVTANIGVNPHELPVNSQFYFTINTPLRKGYLAVMEIDTDGDLDLLYPKSRQAEDGLADKTSLRLPSDECYSVNAPGAERVKVILFKSQQDAQKLLSLFPPATGNGVPFLSMQDAQSHKVTFSNAAGIPFWTDALSFTVTEDQQD